MAKLLLNTDGKVLTSNDKVLKAPEWPNVLKTLLDVTKSAYHLFGNYLGESVDDVIGYDYTSNVTNMSYMFKDCEYLQSIPKLNTDNVTNMEWMFQGCSNLKTIPLLNTSNVTKMAHMFAKCINLQTIPQLNTSNVTNMELMFDECGILQTIPKLNTNKVKNMNSMFKDCTNLQTIPQLDTSNVTDMQSMFYDCGIKTIPLLDTSKVWSMTRMFYSCIYLNELPLLDTTICENMNNSFYGCMSLKTIDLTSLDKIETTNGMKNFAAECYILTKLIIRTMTVIPPLDTSSFYNCYHFTGTKDSTYNPEGLKDGRIYVPDNMVNSLKTATNWSAYADIIVPLSSLEE